MKIAYVVQYLEHGMELMYQIHSVTTSEKHALEVARMLVTKEEVSEAGYEKHNLIELGELIEENQSTISK